MPPSSPRFPAADVQSQPRQRRVWARVAAVAVLLLAACTLAVWVGLARLGLDPRDAWQAWHERAPSDLVRHAERRLMGHTRLQALLQPVLDHVRGKIEREPPPALPDLGKGQRPLGLSPLRFDAAGRPAPAIPLLEPMRPPVPDSVLRSNAEIASALARAQAGQVLEIAPGHYDIRSTLHTGNGGTAERPITLRAARPGTVTLTVTAVQGIVVSRPYWVFENLAWRGACSNHGDCEHAYHVVGGARGTVIRNNLLSDFNAHVKINGQSGQWPDDGLLQFNTLTNTVARRTRLPVASVDLVAASGWQFVDNRVENFVNAGGNGVGYGMFMKGAGRDGRIERNLVVCSPAGISRPGLRVGISIGGGGSTPAFCRDARCDAEHYDAVVANNVVAHCNDVGIGVANSRDALVAHNTLINTAGTVVRRPPSNAVFVHNLVDGWMLNRRGTFAVREDNRIESDMAAWLQNPDALDLRWRVVPPTVGPMDRVPTDFCGNRRPVASPPGATIKAAC